jgi:hypothetical protein
VREAVAKPVVEELLLGSLALYRVADRSREPV